MEFRVLIHAPRGRDAAVVQGVVQLNHAAHVCSTPAELLAGMSEGAAAAVLTEEALADESLKAQLQRWLSSQPPWSDFPFVVLASKQPGPRPVKALAVLHAMG